MRVAAPALLALLAACDQSPSDEILRINEFMASNDSVITDADGDFEDWIELYNPGDRAVDLDGWMLTDDLAWIDRHVLSGRLEVPPDDFLILWADGDPPAGDDHVDFRLARGGERIVLHDPWERRVDVIVYGAQTTDLSQARVPDGDGDWVEEADPTPGETNG